MPLDPLVDELTDTPPPTHCRACGAPIFWLTHPTTGKPAPITVKANARGNILIVGAGYEIVNNRDRGKSAPHGLHYNHFFDCRDAARFAPQRRRPADE